MNIKIFIFLGWEYKAELYTELKIRLNNLMLVNVQRQSSECSTNEFKLTLRHKGDMGLFLGREEIALC